MRASARRVARDGAAPSKAATTLGARRGLAEAVPKGTRNRARQANATLTVSERERLQPALSKRSAKPLPYGSSRSRRLAAELCRASPVTAEYMSKRGLWGRQDLNLRRLSRRFYRPVGSALKRRCSARLSLHDA
jgi:hypothetical protein